MIYKIIATLFSASMATSSDSGSRIASYFFCTAYFCYCFVTVLHARRFESCN